MAGQTQSVITSWLDSLIKVGIGAIIGFGSTILVDWLRSRRANIAKSEEVSRQKAERTFLCLSIIQQQVINLFNTVRSENLDEITFKNFTEEIIANAQEVRMILEIYFSDLSHYSYEIWDQVRITIIEMHRYFFNKDKTPQKELVKKMTALSRKVSEVQHEVSCKVRLDTHKVEKPSEVPTILESLSESLLLEAQGENAIELAGNHEVAKKIAAATAGTFIEGDYWSSILAARDQDIKTVFAFGDKAAKAYKDFVTNPAIQTQLENVKRMYENTQTEREYIQQMLNNETTKQYIEAIRQILPKSKDDRNEESK